MGGGAPEENRRGGCFGGGWLPLGRVGLAALREGGGAWTLKKGQLQTQKEERAFQELGELEQGCGGGNMEDSFWGGGR